MLIVIDYFHYWHNVYYFHYWHNVYNNANLIFYCYCLACAPPPVQTAFATPWFTRCATLPRGSSMASRTATGDTGRRGEGSAGPLADTGNDGKPFYFVTTAHDRRIVLEYCSHQHVHACGRVFACLTDAPACI